jgi:hypothetical protein
MAERKAFTEEEQRILNDRYWSDEHLSQQAKGDVVCPSCRATVHIKLSQAIGYPRLVIATCDGCGKHSKFRAAPEQGKPFTDDELREAAELHQRRATPRCPHDATPLIVHEMRCIGGPLDYRIRCPRCGATGDLSQFFCAIQPE